MAQDSSWLPEGFELSGQVAAELRYFPEDPAFDDQLEHYQPSGFVEPELRWESGDRNTQAVVTPFYRYDGQDEERTHFDLREGYLRRIEGDWEFLVGANQVFWGVTESRHLVNIVNQIDAVEDIDEEDFLGQPMVQVGRQTDLGRFDLFLMTGFRERTFPGRNGRLRGPLRVDTRDAIYESELEEWRPEAALRYSHFIGDFDIGLHAFHGTGREPDLLVSNDGDRLIPSYQVITQGGADLQYTTDAWLWKFEGLVRAGQGSTFGAAVAGVEYTLYQVFETDADLGLLAEGLYDGRDQRTGLSNNERRVAQGEAQVFPTTLDRDVFLGSRLTLNDVQDTAVLAGIVVDLRDGASSFRMEAERRLFDSWKIELEATVFLEGESDNTAATFQDDSFVLLRLSKFF